MSTTLEHLKELVVSSKSTTEASSQAVEGRYLSLDAFRGFIMLMLVSRAFGFRALAQHPNFSWIANQFEHVEWRGMAFWDLIQPAFMFMVGMAMPFALARRMAQGDSTGKVFRHVAWRSFILILLSQVLISVSDGKLSFQLINVLSQIAFAYFFCFLIMQMRFGLQVLAVIFVLAGHWGLFALFPGSEGAYSRGDNIGARIDLALLGRNYQDYYVTINFISSIATTLFGVWTGMLLIKRRRHAYNVKILASAALACFLLGLALQPFNPVVKKLWTESFTFASTGWVLLMLLAFYCLVEIAGQRKIVFPLLVLGSNSIFIYSVSMVLYKWLDRAVAVFSDRFAFIGTLAPVAQATAVVLLMWYGCYWLYQRKIFFKI